MRNTASQLLDSLGRPTPQQLDLFGAILSCEWPEAPESVYPEMPAQPAVLTPTGSAT